jgi:hypothetical protein
MILRFRAPFRGTGRRLGIPSEPGHPFRGEGGHHSDVKAATHSEAKAATVPT